MKKKYLQLILVTILLVLLPTQISGTTISDTDGCKYTMEGDCSRTYKPGTLFEVNVELTADAFGENVVSFYDIKVNVNITGDSIFRTQNTTLPDIEIVGASESTNFLFNLTGISDENFLVLASFTFWCNNTQDSGHIHGALFSIRQVTVKANFFFVLPILTILSLAYITNKRKKR